MRACLRFVVCLRAAQYRYMAHAKRNPHPSVRDESGRKRPHGRLKGTNERARARYCPPTQVATMCP